jgi:PAS domain S-box-containing protein
MNPTAEILTRCHASDALHQRSTDIFQFMNGQSVKMPILVEKAIQMREVVGLSDHAILIAQDGSEWPVEGSASPIVDAAGRITGVVVVFRKISSRKAEVDLDSQNSATGVFLNRYTTAS